MSHSTAVRNLLIWPALVILFFPACRSGQSRVIENLRAFARLYGYVRYFHPSEEAARIDWDDLAVYGAAKVKGAKDARELKSVLEELFLPVAPLAGINLSGETPDEPAPSFPEDPSDFDVVAWQHRGLGFGRGNGPYMSVRINTENILWTGTGSAVLTQGIDAGEIRGKDIRLKSFVRTNVRGAGNQAQLWLRVDRERNIRGFFDNMSDRPIRSREWREYEITGRVDSDARMVFFGAILSGNGKSWWDGFHLRVKGEEGDWEDLDIQNPGFEEDTAGRIPGQWAGKSPGYNYIVQKNNPAEGQNCLLLESGSIPFKGKLFGEHPKIGEAVIKELDGGLSCRIPLALPGDEGGTWNAHKNGAFDTLVSKIESFDPGRHTAEREDVRLAGVTIAWNVFQHFYPYFDEAGVDWDAELTHALTEALADRDAEEFYATLSRMVAKLKDGHGNVMHESRFGLEGFPIRLEWIESKLVVTASQDPRHFRRGDIIRSIDGVEAEKALLEDEKLISGSSQWKRIQSCRRFGYGKSGTFARFVIKRGEDILSFEAERNFRGAVLEQKGPPIQELEKGVFYVDLDRAQWNVIRERIGTLAQAEGVICDMRGYPKGNHEIICHLLKEKDTSGAWMRIPQIIYPDREKIAGYHKMGWHLVPKEPHIKGKVAFVTDARAISYAESFLSFVEHYKLGEIIGGPTAGANGNVNPFSLPGGYTIAWTGMKVLKHDGTRHHLIGIQPTVPCERTIQGVREGRDELLAKALEVVR